METSTCYNNKPQFLVEFKDDSLLLSLDIVLSELSFVWLFHCVLWKQDCQLVLSELLVKPLLNTLKTLNDEKYALLDIVARKDKEISEYKNFFGTIPKVSVTTQPFSLEDFESTYLTEQHMSKNSNEVWMPHIRELFGSFISFGEDKKQRLSRLLGFETNEAIDSKDFHARNEVKVETKREKKDKRESSFVDEITRDSESEKQNQATQLTTRRKLLKTMSLEEKQKETPKKRKRLF